MTGWIKLHRDILHSDLWNDVTAYRVFSYLLLNATHQDGVKISGLTLKRGQWIRSYRQLSEDLKYKDGRGLKKYSVSTIKKAIDRLKGADRVTVKETELGTLFTIVNYASYQGFNETEIVSGNGSENASQNVRETFGKRSGNNNKNVKNVKNAKNGKTTSSDVDKLNDFEAVQIIENLQSNKILHQNQIPPQALYDDLDEIRQNFGFDNPLDMIEQAIKEAARHNAYSWNYVYKILRNWKSAGFKDYEEVEAQEQRKQGRSYAGGHLRKEMKPDWLGEPEKEREHASNELTPEEAERERKELEESLKEFKR